MTTSLEDLITTKTPEVLLAEEITVAQSEGLDTTSWQSFTIIRTILTIFAYMLSTILTIIVEPIKGGFGDLLTSIGWAKVFAKDFYDVDAIESEPAEGFVDITNPLPQEYVHAPGDLIVSNSVTGKMFRNTVEVTILARTNY
jgi:hypothetical protein